MGPTTNRRPGISSWIKLGLALFAFILLLFGVIKLWDFLEEKTVSLTPSAGTTITLAQQSGDGLSLDKTIVKTDYSKKIRVAAGTYVVQYSGQGYLDQLTSINIQDNTTLKTPSLSYSSERLTSQLQEEQPAIQAVLAQVKEVQSGYIVSQPQLYDKGDWYAAKLNPPNPDQQDILSIILRKDSGGWKVVATPSLVFYTRDYSSIPADVIKNINNR